MELLHIFNVEMIISGQFFTIAPLFEGVYKNATFGIFSQFLKNPRQKLFEKCLPEMDEGHQF